MNKYDMKRMALERCRHCGERHEKLVQGLCWECFIDSSINGGNVMDTKLKVNMAGMPTDILVNELCDTERKIDELKAKKEIIFKELMERQQSGRLKGVKYDKEN
jgi:hypothetical protein